MHPRLTDIVVEKVRQRHSERDCPVTPAYDVETLEFALLDLAGRVQATPAPDLPGLESARRCDTNLVGAGGECTACQADQGEACRSPARTMKAKTAAYFEGLRMGWNLGITEGHDAFDKIMKEAAQACSDVAPPSVVELSRKFLLQLRREMLFTAKAASDHGGAITTAPLVRYIQRIDAFMSAAPSVTLTVQDQTGGAA